MIDRSSDDWQAEDGVDAAECVPASGRGVDGESKQFHRDMALTMVHSHDGVVLFGAQLHEHRVAGHGSLGFASVRDIDLVLCDAESESDLDAIVRAGDALLGPVLWCGAAGVARLHDTFVLVAAPA